ncbi:Nonsense-mediated mRNA decay protein 5 [Microbotryomycetes sp. JL201]|nr:Nonsense-mediated mRNA decay protein 5 [Microbotryomycetes sp. JL201]
MDADTLFRVFEASFSQDPNVRIQAELELRKLEQAAGLVSVLVQLIAPPSHASAVVKLAAAIYLKNRVKQAWRSRPADGATAAATIPAEDKHSLKQHLLPLLAELSADQQSAQVKAQVAEVLDKVVAIDFPDEWPTLTDEINQLLQGSEAQVEAGLTATNCVFSSLRYNGRPAENDNVLASLVTLLLPRLLALSQKILEPTPTDAGSLSLQGSLAKLIVKSYKNSISHVLTEAHQSNEMLVPWGTLLLQIVQRQIPLELLPEDADERDKHPWAKTKKWACFSLNKLFERYGNPSSLPSNMKQRYGPFAERFIAQFAPEIVKVYMGVVERIVSGEWQARKVQHYLLGFFEECVKPKATWTLVKPHILDFVQQFVFPLACLTDEEVEMFSDDPQEFARTHFGDFVQDTYSSPQASALAFVTTLVDVRPQHTLKPLLNFIQEVSSKYPAETTARQKDGALRLLACVAGTAVKAKKIAPMMESFFTTHILPEFKSPHGFLRYRVCEVVERYEANDMKWSKRENLETTLRALMDCVTDSELPVRIQAAIALPELVRYEDIRASMVPNIGRIIQELLKLSNEVDLDALTNTTRSLVSEFQDETESFSRLVRESLEARERDPEFESLNFDDEKMLVQMNILKTIEQLTSSLEGTELLDKVEATIAPALEVVIRNHMVELYDEVFEILDSLTFFQKKINPIMWPIFEATYATFMSDAMDYVHEMSGFIDNCVTYGSDVLSTNTEYRKMILDVYNEIMTSTRLGAEDRVVACKLADSMLLNMRGQIDEALPPIVEKSMTFILSTNDDPNFVVTTSLFLHALLSVIMAMWYNPAMTMTILDAHDWTQQFFAHWFKRLSKLNRVHDKKISIEAICAILEWLVTNPASSLNANVGQFVSGGLVIFSDFAEALAHKREQERNFAEAGNDDDDFDEDDFEGADEDFDEDETGEEGDVRDATAQYLDMLAEAQARREANGDADDESETGSTWSDEVLWQSPLDNIDAYVHFTGTLTALERSAPQLFQHATAGLSAEQRAQLEQIGVRAMRGGERADVPAPVQVQHH